MKSVNIDVRSVKYEMDAEIWHLPMVLADEWYFRNRPRQTFAILLGLIMWGESFEND